MYGRKRELAVRFLGEDAAQHGAFGLLGLTPDRCTAVHVETALQMRLDQLRRHPEGEGRDADEVRLMLHEAAQHLLDPVVRQALIQHLASAESQAADPAQSSPTGVHTSRRAGPIDAGDRYAQRTLERYESDRDARRERLTVMAIGGAAVLLVLVFLSALVLVWPQGGQPAGPAAAPAPPVAAGAPTPAPRDQSLPTDPSTASSQAGADPLDQPPTTPAHADAQRVPFMEPSLLLKRLRDAARNRAANPESAQADFAAALAAFIDHWPALEESVVRASVEAIVQYVHADHAGPDPSDRPVALTTEWSALLAARAANPDRPLAANELTRSAASAGLAARLSRERDLSVSANRLIAAAVNALIGGSAAQASGADGTFEGGVARALARSPLLLVAPRDARPDADAVKRSEEAIKRWIECLDAVTRGNEQQAESMLVNAIETLLVNAKDPQDDLRVHDAVQALVRRCTWRDGGPARQALMAWFRDPRVSTGDIRLITRVLVSESSAADVDATMALGLNASSQDRARLRTRYAQAWGFAAPPGAEGNSLTSNWLAQADRIVDESPASQTPGWWLWQSVRLARLNLAARAIWLGESDNALFALDDADPPRPEEFRPEGASNIFAPGATPQSPAGGGGGQAIRSFGQGTTPGGADSPIWAERFLAAERNIPLRLERLRELDAIERPLSPADAQVLAETAVFGVPIQVQVAAQAHVGRDANDASVVAAMLELMPRAPKNRLVSDTIEKISLRRLPPVTDPGWDVAARRALVERLLNLLAVSSPDAWQEELAQRIARIYLTAMSEEISGAAPAADALRGAQLLQAYWRQEAERTPFAQGWGVTLPQLDSRAEGRRQLASGPVQLFAAEQASAAEAMAFVLAAERGVAAKEVQKIMDELARSRRNAGHVFQQILSTERAMTLLWRLRLRDQRQVAQ